MNANGWSGTYRQTRQTYETDLFDAIAGRFFAERFAAVALAGRVPRISGS